jgi:hypothetical protein
MIRTLFTTLPACTPKGCGVVLDSHVESPSGWTQERENMADSARMIPTAILAETWLVD